MRGRASVTHLKQGMQHGLGGAAVKGVGSRDVEAILDDVQIPIGQIRHRKAL